MHIKRQNYYVFHLVHLCHLMSLLFRFHKMNFHLKTVFPSSNFSLTTKISEYAKYFLWNVFIEDLCFASQLLTKTNLRLEKVEHLLSYSRNRKAHFRYVSCLIIPLTNYWLLKYYNRLYLLKIVSGLFH